MPKRLLPFEAYSLEVFRSFGLWLLRLKYTIKNGISRHVTEFWPSRNNLHHGPIEEADKNEIRIWLEKNGITDEEFFRKVWEAISQLEQAGQN